MENESPMPDATDIVERRRVPRVRRAVSTSGYNDRTKPAAKQRDAACVTRMQFALRAYVRLCAGLGEDSMLKLSPFSCEGALMKRMHQIEADLHYGNFVYTRWSERKEWEPMPFPVRIGMHLLYWGSIPTSFMNTWTAQGVLHWETERLGKIYDHPNSRANIIPFINLYRLRDSLSELLEPNLEAYACFNDFFSRALRPDARPIDDPEEPLVVSSVADCRLVVYPSVRAATEVWIKGQGFSVPKLLGCDDWPLPLAWGCRVAIHRLAPQDYHRWHSPVDGTIIWIDDFGGSYHTVNPQAVVQESTLDVFCENRRSSMKIREHHTGRWVFVVAIGAMLVGSINYCPGVEVGKDVNRGECLGMFRYGGSTVVVVFDNEGIDFDPDLVRNSYTRATETLVKVGVKIGKLVDRDPTTSGSSSNGDDPIFSGDDGPSSSEYQTSAEEEDEGLAVFHDASVEWVEYVECLTKGEDPSKGDDTDVCKGP